MDKKQCVVFVLICFLFIGGCSNDDREKHQRSRKNTVYTKEYIKEIVIEDVLIGNSASLYLLDKYLIVRDPRNPEEQIHIFNKNTFEHLKSTAPLGQGPDEITRIGHIGVDNARKNIYVIDAARYKVFSYQIDSLITSPYYSPKVKTTFKIEQIPRWFYYINDTLSIGMFVLPTSASTFNISVSRWNMVSGKIESMPYTNPRIKRKRIDLAVSPELNLYVECYRHNDLITICSLDGQLKYNIYGPNWNDENSNDNRYFGDVQFCKDKIVVSYFEKTYGEDDGTTTTLLVFNLTGDYIKTLNVGYRVRNLCYDKENNRLLFVFDDEIQFGYLPLDNLI
ncbi:MAG: 6-bladed beta-propeller [Mediterranea sp.]|jgi:hypothetical protein|nr:6-bladed beta-propeller [Mediterranea sp.]